jgi:hypothetical protein
VIIWGWRSQSAGAARLFEQRPRVGGRSGGAARNLLIYGLGGLVFAPLRCGIKVLDLVCCSCCADDGSPRASALHRGQAAAFPSRMANGSLVQR